MCPSTWLVGFQSAVSHYVFHIMVSEAIACTWCLEFSLEPTQVIGVTGLPSARLSACCPDRQLGAKRSVLT